jgi:predicted metalloprotease with PDZ domain
MFRRIVLIFFTCLAVASAADRAPVQYTLRFPDAKNHYLDVEAEIPTDGQDAVTLFMPVWTPGSYLVREYARNIVALVAQTEDGLPLQVEKISKNRWTVAASGQARVRIGYRLFARDVNVRGNWIEHDFALINGAPTFLSVADDYQRPYTVRVELPPGWTSIQTPLPSAAAPNTFTAIDFDQLVDSPMVAGNPQVDAFEVDGVAHVLVTLGGDGVWDNARVARNLARLVETQREFWGGLPYRTPYYFFNLLAIGRGGLEHTHSTVLGADRWLSRSRNGINSWLSLASHEFFHVWNGKRLRPAEHGPFDYEQEVYTRSLWIVEGITSHYQHIMLRLAGFTSREDYLNTVSSLIAGVQKTPGRLKQSLSDASFDAWIKAYRPDENSRNVLFSYYTGGSMAALLLDTEIRRASGGAKSLDDVMRTAYRRYSGDRGYTEAQFIALAGEIAGTDLSDWIRHVVSNPGEWDYTPLLDWYGLEFEPPAKNTKVSPNRLEPPDPPKGWLGAETKSQNGLLQVASVRTGSPAANAGLAVNDEIVAIDDYRVTPEQLAGRLEAYQPGDSVTLVVARRDQLLRLPVTLGAEPSETWRLKIRSDATVEQKTRLRAWIGEDPPTVEPVSHPAGTTPGPHERMP